VTGERRIPSIQVFATPVSTRYAINQFRPQHSKRRDNGDYAFVAGDLLSK
jgi:hypothetical protein